MPYQSKIKKVLQKYPILFAYLFGSQVLGKTGPLSDIDIAVFFIQGLSKKERDSLSSDIQDELEKELKMPEKIDVVSLNDSQPLLEREVVYKGKLIYCKDAAQKAHYEAGAMGRWLDWKWYEDKFNQAIEKQFLKPIKPYGQ